MLGKGFGGLKANWKTSNRHYELLLLFAMSHLFATYFAIYFINFLNFYLSLFLNWRLPLTGISDPVIKQKRLRWYHLSTVIAQSHLVKLWNDMISESLGSFVVWLDCFLQCNCWRHVWTHGTILTLDLPISFVCFSSNVSWFFFISHVPVNLPFPHVRRITVVMSCFVTLVICPSDAVWGVFAMHIY